MLLHYCAIILQTIGRNKEFCLFVVATVPSSRSIWSLEGRSDTWSIQRNRWDFGLKVERVKNRRIGGIGCKKDVCINADFRMNASKDGVACSPLSVQTTPWRRSTVRSSTAWRWRWCWPIPPERNPINGLGTSRNTWPKWAVSFLRQRTAVLTEDLCTKALQRAMLVTWFLKATASREEEHDHFGIQV